MEIHVGDNLENKSAEEIVQQSLQGKNSERSRKIVRTSIIGILANVFLAAFKAAVGVLSHSIAITLDAVNNISDAGSSLITIIGTKLAGRQPDKKHPWGHGRAEYLSAMVISVIILYAGITSLVESIRKIIHPETPDYTVPMLIIVGAAIAVKILLGLFVRKTGRELQSESLENSGTDAMMDAVISAATLVAAVIFLIFHVSLEAYLGAVIALIIIKSGFDMLRSTLSELLGERVSAESARMVRQTLLEQPGVHGVYDVIFHDYGPNRLNCSAHVEVDDTMNAAEIDRLTRTATEKLYLNSGILMTAIGVYPVNTQDSKAMSIREDVYKRIRAHEHVLEVHGFYLDDRRMQFDIIIDFEVKDRYALYREITDEIRKAYPEYQLVCTLDTDFSVSE